MIVKLLTEHHLEFLSLKGGYRGSSESTHVKMPHFWKAHALAHIRVTSSESKCLVTSQLICMTNKQKQACFLTTRFKCC